MTNLNMIFQFIDWLKFETHPSSLLNFGTAYKDTERVYWLAQEQNMRTGWGSKLNSCVLFHYKFSFFLPDRVRTLFQKQISRTFPGLRLIFKGSKIHINSYTPKISMLLFLTVLNTLHVFS